MQKVSPESLKDCRGRIVDVRDLDEFAAERLPGAQCVPLDRLLKTAGGWDPSEDLVLLCRTGKRATQAMGQLAEVGFNQLRVVEGGLDACKKAGLEIIRGRKRIPLYRQVMIGAGLVVGMGLLLALINPWFLLIDAFVACGLTMAGITGFCPMAKVLERMPWNANGGCASGSCVQGA